MQVLFQDVRNSNQTQPSAAIALGAAKGRGYGLMIWLSCFAPPCPPCLAAVCCPIGLTSEAETPQQIAVSIVAELLAVQAGSLKRLRFEE